MTTHYALYGTAVLACALVLALQYAATAQEVIQDSSGNSYYGVSGLVTGRYFNPNGPMPSWLNRPLDPGEQALFRHGKLPVPAVRAFTFGSVVGDNIASMPGRNSNQVLPSVADFGLHGQRPTSAPWYRRAKPLGVRHHGGLH